MVVCATLQIVMILPHHHHDGSAVACYDPTHCLYADDYDHEHDEDVSECSFSHIDFVVPARDQSYITAQSIFLEIINSELLFDDLLISFVGICHYTTDSHTQFLIHQGEIPLHTIYIPKALPPRAPTV